MFAGRPHRRSRLGKPRASAVALWLVVALALVGVSIAIGKALDSLLLGGLGADCVFLLTASIYTSRRGSAARAQY